MNELKKLWNDINKKVDVFLLLFIILIIIDIGYFFKLYAAMTAKPDIYFPPVRKVKDTMPKIVDEFANKEVSFAALPEQYKILSEVNLFKPPYLINQKSAEKVKKSKFASKVETGNDEKITIVRKEAELQEITGFKLDGIIAGKSEGSAIIKEEETGNVYIAKTGEYLQGTNIKVKNIKRGKVILSRPGYKDTTFTLEKDSMFQYWLEAEPEQFNK